MMPSVEKILLPLKCAGICSHGWLNLLEIQFCLLKAFLMVRVDVESLHFRPGCVHLVETQTVQEVQ